MRSSRRPAPARVGRAPRDRRVAGLTVRLAVALLAGFIIALPAARAQAADSPRPGESPPPAESPRAGVRKAVVPFLWRVESETATIYLYGSIHAAPPEALPPAVVVREAFNLADRLVTEVALSNRLEEEISLAMADVTYLPDELSLRGLIDEAEWDVVAEWADESGIDLAVINRLQPWITEQLVAQSVVLLEGFASENGLDVYFSDKATARGIPQSGLESVEEQISVLAGAGLADQARSLVSAVASRDVAPLEIAALYDAWRSGDEEELRARIADHYGSSEEDPDYRRLFADRNRAWVEDLNELLAGDESAFVVVGAGHLVGPANVLELLASAGFLPVRLRSPADLRGD